MHIQHCKSNFTVWCSQLLQDRINGIGLLCICREILLNRFIDLQILELHSTKGFQYPWNFCESCCIACTAFNKWLSAFLKCLWQLLYCFHCAQHKGCHHSLNFYGSYCTSCTAFKKRLSETLKFFWQLLHFLHYIQQKVFSIPEVSRTDFCTTLCTQVISISELIWLSYYTSCIAFIFRTYMCFNVSIFCLLLGP